MLKQLSLDDFKNAVDEGAVVLDFRETDEFCAGHVPGSICMTREILLTGLLSEYIDDKKLIVIGAPNQTIDNLKAVAPATTISGVLDEGFESWQSAGYPFDVVILIEADEILMDMKIGTPEIIDIRSEENYEASHLMRAENIPAEYLVLNHKSIPTGGRIFYLYDTDGDLTVPVISLLKRHGLHNFYAIKDGFNGLKVVDAPLQNQLPKTSLN